MCDTATAIYPCSCFRAATIYAKWKKSFVPHSIIGTIIEIFLLLLVLLNCLLMQNGKIIYVPRCHSIYITDTCLELFESLDDGRILEKKNT